MAPFNPPINPLNPDDFTRKSRAVDIDQGIKPQGVAQNQIMPHGVMQGDESAKYAGEAEAAGIKSAAVTNTSYGDLFKDIVSTVDLAGKGGVELVKKDIENKVYEVADRERQSYTDILQKVKAGIGVKNVLDSNAEMTEEESTPAEVAGLPDSLAALQGARDSGKISGTYYQSRLLAEAKTLRAQYPGFREYIDGQFAKVTGTNPANAYIHSLVQDINRTAASTSSQKNKMLSFNRGNMDTIPNAPQVYQDYDAGLITDADVLKKSYPAQKLKSDLNMNHLIFQDENTTRQEKERVAGISIDKAAGGVVSQAVETLTAKMGLNTKDDLNKLTELNTSGAITGPMWQQYGQTIANTRSTLFTKMIADADRNGYTQAIGGKAEVIKRVNAALEPLDEMTKRVYNHDFGGIFDTKNQLTTQNDETKKGLLNDPKIGPYWQLNQAVKDIGGEQNLQNFNLNSVKGDFNQAFQAYFGRVSKNFATQQSMKTSGVPYTFNDVIDNLKKNKVTDGKFNESVLNEVKKIADPSLPKEMRMNYALAAFSDGNRGMISRLQSDGADANGKTTSGQNSVFQRFTSPEITHEMFKLGKENPQIWNQYVDWAKTTLSKELMNKEIKNLANVSPDDNSNISVGWDAKNHRFKSEYITAPGTINTPTPGYRIVEGAVNRLNANLYNYKNIAKETGEDPDAFILKSIADTAGPEALRNVTGIPYKLMREMGLARMNMMQNAR